MRNKLLAIAIFSLSANAFSEDINIDLNTKTYDQSIKTHQYANIISDHVIHIRNNTDEKKHFRYTVRLCADNAG